MAILEQIGDGIWTGAVPLKMGGMDIGTRVTIARLEDGGLFVHSPPRLTEELKAEVDALGPVRTCVAPNLFHHLYVRDWKQAYPEAAIHAPPGLQKKRKTFEFDGVLGDDPAEPWRGVLAQKVVDGAPALGEVVFHHPASGTLIATDLAMNFHHGNWLTRTFARVNRVHRRFGPSLLTRMLLRDHAAARASLDHMLQWDFDRVLITHGDPLESGGKETLRQVYSWL